MTFRKGHKFTDADLIAVAALQETVAQARVASLGGGEVFERARVQQLTRDRDRALGRGDRARAAVLEAKLAEGAARGRFMSEQTEREAVVPRSVPKGQAALRGRVTKEGRGQENLRVGLIDPDGEEIASDVTDKRGGFDIAHPPVRHLTICVSEGKGQILLERKGVVPAQPGSSCYVELPIDGRKPKEPPPPAPPKDGAPARVTVPALRGLTEDAARGALKEVGLRGRLAETVETDDMAGLVIKHDPEAGETVPTDTVVAYILGAKRKEPFPDLRGQALSTTLGALEERKLAVQSIVLVDDKENAGRIVDHVPAPEAAITPDTRVLLRVATGENGADLTTASVLFDRDPRAQKIKFSGTKFRRRLSVAGVKQMVELRKLADANVVAFAEALDIEDRQSARTLQQVLGDILKRFPAG